MARQAAHRQELSNCVLVGVFWWEMIAEAYISSRRVSAFGKSRSGRGGEDASGKRGLGRGGGWVVCLHHFFSGMPGLFAWEKDYRNP